MQVQPSSGWAGPGTGCLGVVMYGHAALPTLPQVPLPTPPLPPPSLPFPVKPPQIWARWPQELCTDPCSPPKPWHGLAHDTTLPPCAAGPHHYLASGASRPEMVHSASGSSAWPASSRNTCVKWPCGTPSAYSCGQAYMHVCRQRDVVSMCAGRGTW